MALSSLEHLRPFLKSEATNAASSRPKSWADTAAKLDTATHAAFIDSHAANGARPTRARAAAERRAYAAFAAVVRRQIEAGTSVDSSIVAALAAIDTVAAATTSPAERLATMIRAEAADINRRAARHAQREMPVSFVEAYVSYACWLLDPRKNTPPQTVRVRDALKAARARNKAQNEALHESRMRIAERTGQPVPVTTTDEHGRSVTEFVGRPRMWLKPFTAPPLTIRFKK